MTFLFLKLTYTVSRKKNLKNAKTTQNMVNFFIVNVQKKHEHVFFFNDNSFLCFFFTLPNTPLCTTFCLEKCSKCVFNRADYLILFQINILAIRTLTIDMFRRTNYKKKCIHCFIKQVLLKRKNTITYKYCIYHNLQIVGLQTLQTL